MSDDSELKQMFKAQRMIDEETVPSLDDIHAKSSAARGTSPAPSVGTLFPVAIAVPAIALAGFIVILTWMNVPKQDQRHAPPKTVTDLHRMNQVCDSLLTTINELDSAAMNQTNQATDQEMQWPTGTDSLISLDTLALSTRTSP